MYKVLVVDDESAMRQGLISKIDWSALQLICAGEAKDGLEAMDKLDALRPDIVLVDIRMPAMDGLALIEQATSRYPNIHWVIISGYGDFEYARQAMKFGVTDYLLKPVNDTELQSCLAKRVELLADQQTAHTNRQLLEQKFALYLGTRREYIFNRLISGKCESGDWGEVVQYDPRALSAGEYWAAAVIDIEPISLPHISFRSGDEPLIWYSLRNIVEEQVWTASRRAIVFRHHTTDHLVVLIPVKSRETTTIHQSLMACLDAIRTCMRLEGAAGVSELVASLKDAHIAYKQASTAAGTKLLHGTGQIYDYAQIRLQERTAGAAVLQASDERMIFTCFSEGRRVELLQWLNQRFGQLVATASSTYYHLERLSIELDTLFRKYLAQHAEPGIVLDEQREGLANIRHWRDALAEAQRKAEFIMNIVVEDGQRSGKQIVAEVKKMIDSSYFENLTLSWVAERYFIHPNYFSKLFKEQCGENFNDYLTKVRFNHAIELLKDPELKIGHIAEMVGYKDATYFSSLFKKVYQVTPQQYRGHIRMN